MTTTTKSPRAAAYDYAHCNLYWKYTAPKGYYSDGAQTVIVNFTKVVELTDGQVVLEAKAIDDYGWWHTGLTVPFKHLAGLERVGYPLPADAPFPVGMRFEWRHGVIRLTVPDDIARRLKSWSQEHWHEVDGYATGYTDPARHGTWAHRALAYLHSVQSHTTCRYPFVEGESFASMKDQHGNAVAEAYELLVTTCGVTTAGMPTTGFHFSG